MVVNNLGYCFECRRDCNDALGVKYEYNIIHKDGCQHVTITCTVNNVGEPTIPAYMDLYSGFKPLTFVCKSEDDFNTFVSSNKSVFGKVGDFIMIANGTLVFDDCTGELVSNDISFYVPGKVTNGVVEFGNNPAIACTRLDFVKGLHVMLVGQQICEAYKKGLLNSFTLSNTESRAKFLKALVVGE